MTIYTIPSEVNFLEELAQYVLDEVAGSDNSLQDVLILLPNRRSCQNLREIFLDKSDGHILLLPNIRPLGDVEEEELYFADIPDIAEKLADLPPVLSAVRREFLLVELIKTLEQSTGVQTRTLRQRILLARELTRLLDQVLIEEVSFDALTRIVPAEFSSHWQITLKFLEILSVSWPQILKENGVMEAAERRNKLLTLQAAHWQKAPPKTPVIAAGSTGTMPATARLMKVIANLPAGKVILPGCEFDMDDQSWDGLEASHPQALFKDLCQKMDIERTDIRYLKEAYRVRTARGLLAAEMMRPAATGYLWRDISQENQSLIRNHLDSIKLYACDNTRQEAMVIALKLREVLESPGKTGALVTPDRNLAQQVKSICTRWGITIDDTGGTRLADSTLGSYILQSLNVMDAAVMPAQLLGFLKHPLSTFGRARGDVLKEIANIDETLRGPEPKDLFQSLEHFNLAGDIAALRGEFPVFADPEDAPLSVYLEQHLSLLEKCADDHDGAGADKIWRGDEGEAAAKLFSHLLNEQIEPVYLSSRDYKEFITLYLQGILLRPKYGTHPRLLIMGQIEARLMKADVMILSGLNEGTWPASVSASPWMSRPMRTEFGLPDLERSIALAAHDFIQAFSAPEVVLTRAQRIDGAPSVPARWLERLDIVINACGAHADSLRDGQLRGWAITMDQPSGDAIPARRPAPMPDIYKRPGALYVTAIETWMRDPYSIYAAYILNLRPLKDIELQADAAQRGTWIHDIFAWFVKTYPAQIPDNAVEILLAKALESKDAPREIALFLPRMRRLIDWFITQEAIWRKEAVIVPDAIETKGSIDLDGFVLSAKADRIDRMKAENAATIIDYKTGRVPANTDIMSGLSPQMSLEGLILSKGGFGDISTDRLHALKFLKLSGALVAGEAVDVKVKGEAGLETLIDEAESGLRALIAEFAKRETPYISLPNTDNAPPEEWQTYSHLARVQEWATIEDGEG